MYAGALLLPSPNAAEHPSLSSSVFGGVAGLPLWSQAAEERRRETMRAEDETSKGGRGMGECGPRIYSCSNCRCHVAEHDDVISKAFQGRNGRAYLFQNVVNVSVGPREDRQLLTGLHTVADIQCFQCQEVLGWKYEKAFDETQKYKEGKYILEKAKVMKEDW